jgi:transcriptional regulator with XRE-family HTH domain
MNFRYSREDLLVSMSEIRIQFGDHLRQLRMKRGWTQVEMSDFLAINRSYLSEMETGKKDPSLTMLKTLADGLGMRVSELLKGL